MRKLLFLVLSISVLVACEKNNVSPEKTDLVQVLSGVSFNGEFLVIEDSIGLQNLFTKLNESTSEKLNEWEYEIGFYSMRRFYEQLGNEEDSLLTLEEKIASGESDLDIYSLHYSDKIISMAQVAIGRIISYQAGDSPDIPASLIPYLPYISINGKVELTGAVHRYYKDRFEVLNLKLNGKNSSSTDVFYFKELEAKFGDKTINSKISNVGTVSCTDNKRQLQASVYDGTGFWMNIWTGRITYYDYAGRKGVSEKKGWFGWHKKKTGTWGAFDNYFIRLTNGTTISRVGNFYQTNQVHTWQSTFYTSRWGGSRILSTQTGTTSGRIWTSWCTATGLRL